MLLSDLIRNVLFLFHTSIITKNTHKYLKKYTYPKTQARPTITTKSTVRSEAQKNRTKIENPTKPNDKLTGVHRMTTMGSTRADKASDKQP